MEWLTIGVPCLIVLLAGIEIRTYRVKKYRKDTIKPGDPRCTDLHKSVKVPEHLREDILVVKYPCKVCMDKCTIYSCGKIERNEDTLLKRIILERCCPDCGSAGFHHGPSGGMSKKVMCTDCEHKFNLGLPFFVERI